MDVSRHRKARLRELIDHTCEGVIAVFANAIGKDESYTARMLYPPEKKGQKPIGDKMMLLIEEKFSLPRAWFDMPLGNNLQGKDYINNNEENTLKEQSVIYQTNFRWPFKKVSVEQWQYLDEFQKSKIEDMILLITNSQTKNQTSEKAA